MVHQYCAYTKREWSDQGVYYYKDLSSACSKDDFPLPLIELLVDATTEYGALSFMDNYSGYN